MKNVVLKKVRVRLIIIILVIIFSVIGFLKIKSDNLKKKKYSVKEKQRSG